MKRFFLFFGVTLVIIMMFVACEKTNNTVIITTDVNSYSPMMSSGSGGIKMTPVFNSKNSYTKLEYHWITDEGEFVSSFAHLGKEVINQGETVLWSAVENDKVIDIKSSFDIRLEVIDGVSKKTLANTKITINPNEIFYEVEKIEQVNIYNGETEINVDGRSFELEDIPENMAEEVVINNFKYSIVGDFDSLSKILPDTETNNISLKNEEEKFNEGDYIQSYTIHEVSTLTINEYNQQNLENGKNNPLYFYGWEEIVEKYNLKEYEIINVKFTQKHSDKSIELGPQWGDGTYNRNFIVGKSSKDNNYKIYEYGGM